MVSLRDSAVTDMPSRWISGNTIETRRYREEEVPGEWILRSQASAADSDHAASGPAYFPVSNLLRAELLSAMLRSEIRRKAENRVNTNCIQTYRHILHTEECWKVFIQDNYFDSYNQDDAYSESTVYSTV